MMEKNESSHGLDDQIESTKTEGSNEQSHTAPTIGLRAFLWPAVCALQLGIIAALCFIGNSGPPESTNSPPEIANKPATKSRTSKESLADWSRRGEAFLRGGQFAEALNIYRERASDAPGPARIPLFYRMALCYEALGGREEALALYSRIVRESSDPHLVTAAQIGQARTWLREGRSQPALDLLYPLLLRSATPSPKVQDMLVDVRYLLAFALSRQIRLKPFPGAFQERLAVPSLRNWSLTRPLAWALHPAQPNEVKDEQPEASFINVSDHPTDPGMTLVTASLQQMPLLQVFQQLASRTSLNLKWSPEVQAGIEGRRVTLRVTKLPLTDVLDALAAPVGLTIGLDQKDILIGLREEETGKPNQAQNPGLEKAHRALREVLLGYPNHPYAGAAYVEAGNLKTMEQNYPDAIRWYEQAIQHRPRVTAHVEASYNLGLVRRHQGNVKLARDAYYRVIDLLPGNELAPYAWLQLGRLYLESGQPVQALVPLRRGVASSLGSPIYPELVLTLAATAMLLEDPKNVRLILSTNRKQLKREEVHQQLAGILDSYATWLIHNKARPVTHSRITQNLLTSLFAYNGSDPVLGPIGAILVGKAYHDLGLDPQMATTYERELNREQMNETTLVSMKYSLAAYWLRAPEKRDAATRILSELGKLRDNPWSANALLRLAQMDFNRQRYQDSLEKCYGALQGPSEHLRKQLLHLMGQTYEKIGEHDKASRCYRGEAPIPDNLTPTDPAPTGTAPNAGP